MNTLTSNNPFRFYILLFLTGILLLSVNTGMVGLEFDPSELHYKQGPAPEHPFLYQTAMELCKTLFGKNWWSVRLPSALFGGLTLAATYYLSILIFNSAPAARTACFVLLSSKLFFRSARIAQPDVAAAFFTTATLIVLYRFLKSRSQKYDPWIFYTLLSFGFLFGGLKTVTPIIIFSGLLGIQNGKKLRQLLVHPGWILPIVTLLYTGTFQDYFTFLQTNNELNLLDGEHSRFGILFHNLGFSFCNFWILLEPWIFIGLFAFPIALGQILKNDQHADALQFIFLWILTVFLCFSIIIKLKGHHALLILPLLSSLLGHYFTTPQTTRGALKIVETILRRILPTAAIAVIILLISFICVFLLAKTKWLVVIAAFMASVILILMRRSHRPETPIIVLAIILYLALSQTPLTAKAGLVPFYSIEKLSKHVNQQNPSDQIIINGSHGLSKSIIQAFFNQPVYKAGESYEEGTVHWLNFYLTKQETVYCFIFKSDYDRYLSGLPHNSLEIVSKTLLAREEIKIDKPFLRAALTMDNKIVQKYLLTEVLLVRKPKGVKVSVAKPKN